MLVVNMMEAKSNLSRRVERVESGLDDEIIIARDGRPAARLVPIAPPVNSGKRLGLLAGQYPAASQEDFDADNEIIGRFFGDGAQS
jgi:prevent-host-death family protein